MEVFCFGIIPLRLNKGGWEVLLVKHRKGHWGYPKGHPEKGESPEQSAVRELFEETALSIKKFFPVRPLIEHYTLDNGRTPKSVTYFLAEVEGKIHNLEIEIDESRWVTFPEAHDLITYPESRLLSQQAEQLLREIQ